MEFYEAVKNRRMAREWSDAPVPEEALMRILDAGLAAPTNNHMRDWEFIVLQSDEEKENALQYVREWSQRQAESKVTEGDRPEQKMYQYAIPRQYSMLADASYVVIPLFKAGEALVRASAVNGLNLFASVWCVIENVFLAASAEGLACSLRIPVGEEGRNVCRALGVPEEYMMACYIGVGVPDDCAETLEQYVYSAEEKMHRGSW
ncbi:MAG: nitroreductase family protein [Solobacterium sp.]|nr:nitroreductase family protein [Solobacterium sp.]